MAAFLTPAMRALCAVEDVPDGGCKGFPPPPGAFTGLFAVRRGQRVFVYVNSCPHIGVPLDWVPDRFLSADRDRIVCATHGAEFRIEDGLCIGGPCLGDRLISVPVLVDQGRIMISEAAASGPYLRPLTADAASGPS